MSDPIEPRLERKEFWLIWNTNGWRPRKPHTSEDAANTEARRLALLHPASKFYVLRAEHLVTCRAPEVVESA
jgi:hypothetical protein